MPPSQEAKTELSSKRVGQIHSEFPWYFYHRFARKASNKNPNSVSTQSALSQKIRAEVTNIVEAAGAHEHLSSIGDMQDWAVDHAHAASTSAGAA